MCVICCSPYSVTQTDTDTPPYFRNWFLFWHLFICCSTFALIRDFRCDTMTRMRARTIHVYLVFNRNCWRKSNRIKSKWQTIIINLHIARDTRLVLTTADSESCRVSFTIHRHRMRKWKSIFMHTFVGICTREKRKMLATGATDTHTAHTRTPSLRITNYPFVTLVDSQNTLHIRRPRENRGRRKKQPKMPIVHCPLNSRIVRLENEKWRW